MSETPKHTKSWEDDGLVGVNCWVKATESRFAGQVVNRPAHGGVAEAGQERECEACGAKLRLHWDVRLVEVSPDV